MVFPLVFMAAFWFAGGYLILSRALRASIVFLVYIAGVLAHTTLPAENELRGLFGQHWGEWAFVGIALGSVLLFRQWLFWLREKVQKNADKKAEEDNPRDFKDVEIDRYARHIFLREIGGAGQKRLKNAKVLIVGAGGLGAPALQYLAAAGVGTIGVVDGDTVDNTNLQRQVIHKDASIDMPKVFSAAQELRAQNPFVEILPYYRHLDGDSARELFADYDYILDGTDNFETRYMINEVAVFHGKPLISAAMTQWEGQISIYDPAREGPCYQCVFPEIPAPGLVPSCAEAGVVGPLPGVIGSLMALETVKEITQAGEGLRGYLLMYDGLYAEMRKISVKRRADCPICGEKNR